MRRGSALLLLLVALACGETTPRSEVMIVVRAEDGVRAAADRLEVVVEGGPAGGPRVEVQRLVYAGEPMALAWPVQIALVPEGEDATRSYAVHARATMVGALVAEARVASGYVPGETLTLDVWLRDACIDVACATTETCTMGACATVAPIDPCDLARLEGPGRSEACAPRDAGQVEDGAVRDGGMDAGLRDAGTMDGDLRDGGPIDASGDGGATDAGSPTERYNVVFATSEPIAPGALGGIGGADALCQMRASAASLPRPMSYVALLSTSSESARTRIASSRGWVRVDGRPFVDTVDDLAAGRFYYPITLAENGLSPAVQDVATGTGANLLVRGGTCGDWTDTSAIVGSVGDVRDGPTRWIAAAGASACNTARSIYCFGTGIVRPLDPPPGPPASARIAFVSTATTDGRVGGIAGFDTICQLEAGMAGYLGTFRALAAPNMTATAASRFVDGEPWYRPDGTLVAADLADVAGESLVAPIALDSSGAYGHYEVWVGAPSPSAVATNACSGWGPGVVLIGNTGISSSTWNFFTTDTQLCGNALRVLCLER